MLLEVSLPACGLMVLALLLVDSPHQIREVSVDCPGLGLSWEGR